MRRSSPAFSLLCVAALLAGCTSDGNLGAIDEGQQRQQAEARQANLWEPPAAAHVADVRVGGSILDIDGGWAALPVGSVTLAASGWRAAPLPGDAAPTHFALVGATLDGARGWLVVNVSGAPTIEGSGAPITLREHALHAEGAALSARVAGSSLVWTEHSSLPPKPAALANTSEVRFPAIDLPAEVTVRGFDLVFHPAEGAARPLTPGARVGAAHAQLAALLATDDAPLAGAMLDIPLVAAPRGDWNGTLTVRASAPSGELALPSGARLLAPYNEATVKMRGSGPAQLTFAGQGWQIAQDDVELVDVRTGQTPRLAASLRLLPDVVEATGPAGNTTRVKLILAETSQGADAILNGYRIDASVDARYVGHEPFAITAELIELMNESASRPITTPALIAIGVALPFVAMLEAFAAFVHAIFPPSVAGTLAAGEAQVLTFDLEMPATPQDVVLLVEAENAEPARATIRMRPTASE